MQLKKLRVSYGKCIAYEGALGSDVAFLRVGQRTTTNAYAMSMCWTPNKVTLLRVLVGFAAVSLFGRGAWANLAAVGLTVVSIALDALDGHIARKKKLA